MVDHNPDGTTARTRGILPGMPNPFVNAWRWVETHPKTSIALGIGGAVLLGAASGASASGPGPLLPSSERDEPVITSGAIQRATPSGYAASKLPRALTDWRGPLGESLRTMAPIAWPGVPPEVFVGFASNGAQRANTAQAPPRGVRNGFAEMGYFGIEGGPRSSPDANAGPYPNLTDRHNNSWLVLHDSALVVRLLGHPATMAHNAWMEDVAAQTAVGLANLLRALESCNSQIPAACRSSEIASQWSIAVAFAAWSAGAGGMARWVRRYQTQLGAVPERQRLAAWISAVVSDAPNIHARAAHAVNPAYTLLRTLQKIESGKLLASRVGGNVAWFPSVSDANQLTITRAAMQSA